MWQKEDGREGGEKMTTTVIVGFLVCYYNITGGCLLPNKLDLIDLHNDSKDVDILLEFRNFQ